MKLVRSKENNRDGSARYFFGCTRFPVCRGIHGADAWGKPLGVPANAETNAARQSARIMFDSYWRGLKLSRSAGYRWLAQRLKLEKEQCSFARFDILTCNQVVEIIQQARKRREGKA